MRSWSPRGQTPVITVRGRSRRRISIAAPACYRPGHRSRLIYRPRLATRPGEHKSFARSDYRDLLIAAHNQLAARSCSPGTVFDTHLAVRRRAFTAAQDWPTAVRLPAYASDLNPVEGIWSLLNHGGLANLAAAVPDHLVRVIKQRLKKICPHPFVRSMPWTSQRTGRRLPA